METKPPDTLEEMRLANVQVDEFWRELERKAVAAYVRNTEHLHLHGNNVAESQAWIDAHEGESENGD